MRVTDQTGRQVDISEAPRRIVSCVPSITELIAGLGAETRLIGRTKFCIHPSSLSGTVEVIGGTKNLKIEKIIALRPDLIVVNKEENIKEQVEALFGVAPVYVSDVADLEDNYILIRDLSLILGLKQKGEALNNSISRGFERLSGKIAGLPGVSCLYLIWKNPWMSVGGDSIISNVMRACGLENVLALHTRYPELQEEMMKELKPDVVLLSSEPFPFSDKHIAEIKSILPDSHVVTVDGTMFSWYGSRMDKAPDYLGQLITDICENLR